MAFKVTRPRKKRFPEAELLARLKRYEDALKSYGADLESIKSAHSSSSAGKIPCQGVNPTSIEEETLLLLTHEPGVKNEVRNIVFPELKKLLSVGIV